MGTHDDLIAHSARLSATTLDIIAEVQRANLAVSWGLIAKSNAMLVASQARLVAPPSNPRNRRVT
jgi:hypothetical protein